MSNKVFVYGTLKKGRGNHRLLEGAIPLGTHVTPPKYNMYSLGGFPGVTEEGSTAITGELYEVDDAIFKRLDGLEGYNPTERNEGLYDRIKIPTPHGEAWIYTINYKYLNMQKPMDDGTW